MKYMASVKTMVKRKTSSLPKPNFPTNNQLLCCLQWYPSKASAEYTILKEGCGHITYNS